MCYYAMHTNFDVMGMADAAADTLALKDRQVLYVTFEDEIAKEGIGRFGRLPEEMTLADCAEYVKRRFSCRRSGCMGNCRTWFPWQPFLRVPVNPRRRVP